MQIDPERLKQELEDMERARTLVFARLEQLPNLDQQIPALLKSAIFNDLGQALQPIKPNITEPTPVKPLKPKLSNLTSWQKALSE